MTIIERLNNLHDWSRNNPHSEVDRKLYALLCKEEMLMLAYDNIKSKPGNMTPGILPETLDGMSIEVLRKLIEKLKDESFDFKTSRRIRIPKGSGGTRPITLASPRDKIIQEAIRLILNSIYEPLFLEESHGFRPNRGCHSALKNINQKFQSTVWMIEGDIEKCFDSINHSLLMNLIEKKIRDRRFTRLIWKSLRAGHMETKTIKHNIIGTFQGSIISPILANIFLHELDLFILSIKKEFDKGDHSKVSKEYNKLRYEERKLREKGLLEEARNIATLRRKTPYSNFRDEDYKKLAYIRYADDWLIGIKGTKEETTLIKEKVRQFLQSIKLNLSESKTKITNINDDKVLFLGTTINRSKHTKYVKTKMIKKLGSKTNETDHKETEEEKDKGLALKRNPRRLRMEAPLLRIKAKLREAGFMKENKSYPKFVWMHMSHSQILERYNAIIRGYLNYYSFVNNFGKFAATIEFILKGSCAKLLAAKFSLKTQAKVFKKFGKQLKDPEKKRELTKIKYNIKLQFLTKLNPNGVVPALYSYKSPATLFHESCAICGSKERIEMHHIRAMKDLKPNKSWIDKLMIKAKRKQIPLCRKCHMIKHRETA